jgi:hypothetical protein
MGGLTLCFLLCAVAYWVAIVPSVRFPADILLFSESDFVADITKLQTGQPVYTGEKDNSSQVYPVGAQFVTNLAATLTGQTKSVPFFRWMQVLFTLAAAFFAWLSFRAMGRLAGLERLPGYSHGVWMAGALLALYLAAINKITNPFVHLLHPDALAQLLASIGFYLLVRYVEKPGRTVLVAMAILPAAGFLVKQYVVCFAGLYAVYLILFDRPRSLRRSAGFVAATALTVLGAAAMCYWLWGEAWLYWTFGVLRSHSPSWVWRFEHWQACAPHLLAGLIGGVAVFWNAQWRLLRGPWVIWLGLYVALLYTSGMSRPANHLGAASLIAAVWLLLVMQHLFVVLPASGEGNGRSTWMPAAISAAAAAMFLIGSWGVTFPPVKFPPPEAYRYVEAISREFEGLPPDRVLLELGSWKYLEAGVVMRDRSASIGDRGRTGIADMSGMLSRIESRYYQKILVRNYHEPGFWYDHFTWPKSSGVRAALQKHYREERVIPAVDLDYTITKWVAGASMAFFNEVTVLVPKERSGS